MEEKNSEELKNEVVEEKDAQNNEQVFIESSNSEELMDSNQKDDQVNEKEAFELEMLQQKEKLSKLNKYERWYNYINLNREMNARKASSNINMGIMTIIFLLVVFGMVLYQLFKNSKAINVQKSKINIVLFLVFINITAFIFIYLVVVNVLLHIIVKKINQKDPQSKNNGILDEFDTEIMNYVRKYVKLGFKRNVHFPMFEN
ncbi:MAG: hypothetical protein ACTTJO_02625 [Metamycoplasmataceae bacterium]